MKKIKKTGDEPSDNRIVIFMQIPKTAGTTMRSILNKQYSHMVVKHSHVEIANSTEQLETADVLAGHFPFGAHQYISRPYTYITLLRDPVERVISHHSFIVQTRAHPRYELVKDIPLHDFVDFMHYSNYQTRYASGDLLSPNLTKAIDNLNHFFSIVGITELFAESVQLMQKKLGWAKVAYRKKNVNPDRPAKEQVSKETIRKIESFNQMDRELYQYFRKRLEEQLKN